MNFRERILSRPSVYHLLKRIVFPKGALHRLVNEHYHVPSGGKVLDLGCGYGDLASHFVPVCSYLGIDHNAEYIARARTLNEGNGAVFAVADLGDPIVADGGPFDLIMMYGVLHHLSDDTVIQVAKQVKTLLAENGRFVAIEGVFSPDQGLIARIIIASDRGRHVRDARGYRTLLQEWLGRVDTCIVQDVLRIPYSLIVLSA